MAKQKLSSFDDVKIGDRLIFDDGKEKLTVTVKKINKSRGDIDATWRRRQLLLLASDFKNGYIFKK